jgi:hypothetical protein
MDDVDNLDKEKCQSLYMNILACQSLNRIPDSVSVREFFETRRCDHVKLRRMQRRLCQAHQ